MIDTTIHDSMNDNAMRQKGQYKALQNRYDFAITIGKK